MNELMIHAVHALGKPSILFELVFFWDQNGLKCNKKLLNVNDKFQIKFRALGTKTIFKAILISVIGG